MNGRRPGPVRRALGVVVSGAWDKARTALTGWFPRRGLAVLPRLAVGPRDGVARQINRAPSRRISTAVPWLSIGLASMAGFSPLIVSAPVMPPFALMLLIGWRLLRPGLLPVWAGLPLGMVDDLFSGQPFGSAVLIWSLVMLAMEGIDSRFLWRSFWQDWLVAALLLAGAQLAGALLAGLAARHFGIVAVLPQIGLAVLLHPVVTKVVQVLDRLRLIPVKLPES